MTAVTKTRPPEPVPKSPQHGRGVRHADKRWGRLLVTPTVILLVIAGIVPLINSIWASFVTHNLRADGNEFVGLDNYIAVLKGFSGSFNLALSAAASWIFIILISLLFYRVIQKGVLS